MTPEGREKLKEIVRELLKHVDMPKSMSEFFYGSMAEHNGINWTVYVDGDKKEGAISADGATSFEAKENAWNWLSSIINECKNNK